MRTRSGFMHRSPKTLDTELFTFIFNLRPVLFPGGGTTFRLPRKSSLFFTWVTSRIHFGPHKPQHVAPYNHSNKRTLILVYRHFSKMFSLSHRSVTIHVNGHNKTRHTDGNRIWVLSLMNVPAAAYSVIMETAVLVAREKDDAVSPTIRLATRSADCTTRS